MRPQAQRQSMWALDLGWFATCRRVGANATASMTVPRVEQSDLGMYAGMA